MTTATLPFPIGAWVRDTFADRLTGGIERTMHGTRFHPTGGEIIGTGKLGGSLVYACKWGEYSTFVFPDAAVCYHCGAADDTSHSEWCPDKDLRLIPHEPGYAA